MNAKHQRAQANVVLLAIVTSALVACSGSKGEASGSAPSNAGKISTDSSARRSSASTFRLTAEQRQRIHFVTEESVTFRPIVEATGSVAFNGDRTTQVVSPVSGPATRIVALPGMRVARGQPMAYVSSPDFADAVARYRKAQTANKNARRIADRDSALFQNDALARGDLEQAQSDAAAAEADLEAAVQDLRALGVEESQLTATAKVTGFQAIIRAPLQGTVVEKFISEGQLLQAGSTPCFTVTDLSTMWVMVSVFANDLHDVAVGQVVEISAGGSDQPVMGKVDYIASLADPGTNAVSVRVLAPNRNQLLRRDLFVRVGIHSNVVHRGLLVPVASVLLDEQSLPFVFIANSVGSFSRRRITRGHRVDDKFEVTSGLSAGDEVVAEGALFIQFAESQ